MGRITWDSRTPFRMILVAAALPALLLGALLVVAAARAAEAEKPEGHGAAAAHKEGHGGEESTGEQEEKSALAHVMDSDEIELFESFGPPAIHLTLFRYH